MKIIHLVKVKINIHGEIVPVDYSHCPKFKNDGIKSFCVCNGTGYTCRGIIKGFSLMKELDKENSILECRYLFEDKNEPKTNL